MRGVHGFGITFKKKFKKKKPLSFEAAKTVSICFMSDIPRCPCVCARAHDFSLWGAKKTKVCTLSKRFNLSAPVFTRECKRLIAFCGLKGERERKKTRGRSRPNVHVCLHQCLGCRLHPNTSAVCHGSTGWVLLTCLRSSVGLFHCRPR